MSQEKTKVWLVTGCTSGLGRAIAETVLAAGYRVVATALAQSDVSDLKSKYPETALIVALDVTKRDAAVRAVAEGEKHFGAIDVLVNNAGFGFMGAVEESMSNEYMPMFNVNLFGAINMMQAVLPGMRSRRRGHIISISSVGGFTASAAFGLYAASKFGVEAVSEALAIEVAALGIKVTVVEPGQFRTNFRGSSMTKASMVIEDYAATSGKTRQFIESSHGTQAGDPVRAAQALIAIAEMPKPPFRLPLGADAFQRIRAKLAAVSADISAVEQLGTGVNFPGVETKSRL
jgi:NAD(P)-dependent dehydrogenase (short-subunit alcohol dehydrogenase family)